MATPTTTLSVLSKLATLTGGVVQWGESVLVTGDSRKVTIRIERGAIEFTVQTFGARSICHQVETLPAGLTFAQIAAHAVEVAGGKRAAIGELATHPDEIGRSL